MVDSEIVVGIKPDDSGVLIEYQVDEFTYIWSVAHLIAWSQIFLVSQARCQH